MLAVAGILIAASVLVIGFLLVLSGFLTAPLLLSVVLAFACLIILGLSIATAVLSRRRN
jgi:hypothetical protein